MKFAITALAALLFACLVYSVGVTKALKTQQKLNSSLQISLTNCEATARVQNAAVKAANESLVNYEGKISEIQKQFNTKSKELNNSLKSVKTCEQGMNYLKTMLNELKRL